MARSLRRRPAVIGKRMGISGDYAEQICRDLVWHRVLVKQGLKYRLSAGRTLSKKT